MLSLEQTSGHSEKQMPSLSGRARADIEADVTDYSRKCGEFDQRELLAQCARWQLEGVGSTEEKHDKSHAE